MSWLAISVQDGVATRLVVGMVAWAVTMGLHEGGHAWAAWWLGDPTAYNMGKRTINPVRHVDWNSPASVISSVVLPAVTSIAFGIPMGMASVPVSPSYFRHPLRDHALVALAGPLGDFVAAVGAFLLMLALWPLLRGNEGAGVELASHIIVVTYVAAIWYGVLNLVPIPPLDGSNILYYFGNQNLRHFMDQIRPFGFFIFIAVFWIGGGGRILDPAIGLLIWPFLNLPPMVWGS